MGRRHVLLGMCMLLNMMSLLWHLWVMLLLGGSIVAPPDGRIFSLLLVVLLIMA